MNLIFGKAIKFFLKGLSSGLKQAWARFGLKKWARPSPKIVSASLFELG